MVQKCLYCRAIIDSEKSPSSGKKSSDLRCNKCQSNEKKYGKPGVCTYCQLQAAFRGGKCVHCSHSQRKHGPPMHCHNCKLKAAFNHPRAKGALLCRLCRASYKRSMMKSSNGGDHSTGQNNNHCNSNHNSHEPGTSSTSFPTSKSSSSSLLESSINDSMGEQILATSQLKDQVLNLERMCAKKDKDCIEKDKKIAALNAQIMQMEREGRLKLQQTQKQGNDLIKSLQEQVRDLTKQVSILSKSVDRNSSKSSSSSSSTNNSNNHRSSSSSAALIDTNTTSSPASAINNNHSSSSSGGDPNLFPVVAISTKSS